MPKYRINAPDGKTYEVNAPDGASQDDVLAYVKQNYQQAANSAAPSPEDLSSAYYQALDQGDNDQAKQAFQAIRQQNATLRPRNSDELNRAQQIAS